MMIHHEYKSLAFIILLVSVLGVMNDIKRDSYMSAYVDFQSSTEIQPGIVYPEHQSYESLQHKTYYGSPHINSGPPLEYVNPYSIFLEIIKYLPEKLEYLPKVTEVLLTVTKIILKVVLLKIILKFVIMFCLFFFLPKLEMLDMATEADNVQSDTEISSFNGTNTDDSIDDQEEMRLNRMTNFILDSVENQPYLKQYCKNNEKKLKCRFLRAFSKFEVASRLFNSPYFKYKLQEIISSLSRLLMKNKNPTYI